MKTITRKLFGSATSLVGGAVLLAGMANAQTIPNFISVSATDEQAIRLTWASVSNEVYEIDEADTLVSLRAKSPTNLRVKITHPLRRDITPQWGDERTQSDTTTNDSCPA